MSSESHSNHTPESNALLVGSEAQPDILIYRHDPSDTHERKLLHIPQSAAYGLESLLHLVPTAINMATTAQLYAVQFAPHIASQIASGSATMMQSLEGGLRAIAVNTQGQIIGHGSLISAAFSPALVATAIWQGLAVITAQHYLSDINRRLEQIEKRLGEIQTWLEDEERATLAYSLERLHSLHTSIAGGTLTEIDIHAFVQNVDTIDHECGKIMKHCALRLQNMQQQISQMNMVGWFDPALEIKQFQQAFQKYIQICQRWAMAALIRATAAEVRYALPTSHAVAVQRIEEIQRDIAQWDQSLKEIDKLTRRQTKNIGAMWRVKLWEDPRDYYEQANRFRKQEMSSANKIYYFLEDAIQSIQQRINYGSQQERLPTTLLIEVDRHGKVTQAWQQVERAQS
ncbi:hypothetical protein F8S13_26650 [Chloroflexia bacterium SDU3-3]|nr:hypothetical protein F8S13_26650 [Chloroflexia bacterium SDU3-3]